MNSEALKVILKKRINAIANEKRENGFDISGFTAKYETLPDSYDELMRAFDVLAVLPKRDDWQYVEPETWEDIEKELLPVAKRKAENAAEKTKSAFLTSVSGCVLGKPVEMRPTMEDMRKAYEPMGEWPISHYLTRDMVKRYGRADMDTSTLEGMDGVDADDDINYTVIGMLTLEKYGRAFTTDNVAAIWNKHLPAGFTWGPESSFLRQVALASREGGPFFDDDWKKYRSNQNLCGAMIRADAFGYANPGDPRAAAEMAWRDGHMTHSYTGVYGEMFAAAAIAAAYTAESPEEIVTQALACIPQKSRLAECVRNCLTIVKGTNDFHEAYDMIHSRYSEYTHCMIYQETGTLINTLFHAKDAGDGICLQVMQGNDTDSYGCTAGSILGAYFGSIDESWIAPFKDKINLALACAPEHSLSALAERMAKLSE